MQCTNCGVNIPEGAEACPSCGTSVGHFKLEDLDLIRRFKVGDKVSGGFNIIAKFIDNVLKSFNAQLIAPYIKYRLRVLQTVMAVILVTVLVSAALAYLEVITGEAFVLLVGIVLGFILASVSRMFGPF
jgi:zinc-ribbon domain